MYNPYYICKTTYDYDPYKVENTTNTGYGTVSNANNTTMG